MKYIFPNKKKSKIILWILMFLMACDATKPTTQVTQTAQTSATNTAPPVQCTSAWKEYKTDDPSNLTLSLELEKTQYQLDELMFSKLVLKNVGTSPLWVNNRMLVNRYSPALESLGDIYFEILSIPSGESALFSAYVNTDVATKQDFVQLEPNEDIEKRLEDIMYYSFGKEGKTGFPEGNYCIWAVYHNQTDPDIDGGVWKGKIKSNPIEFEIK